MSLGELAIRPGTRAGQSSQHSMQEPPVRLRALTENPQLHAVDVECRVVIAPNIVSIPPACLDPLDITHEPERAAATRHSINFLQLLWRRQKPQRPAERGP